MRSYELPGTSEQRPVLPALVASLRLLSRHRKLLLVAGLSSALLAGLFVFFVARPVYRGTAVLLIESQLPTVVDIKDVYGRPGGDRVYFQTQMETLRSRPIIERVVDRLALDTNPVFDPRQKSPPLTRRLASAVGFGAGDADKRPQTPEMIRAAVVEQLGMQLNVRAVNLSDLLQIDFDAPTPELAARIANAIAQAYIDTDFETRLTTSRTAGDMLDGQIAELRARVLASEGALQAYLEKHGLLDRQSAAGSGASLQLSEIDRRIVDARSRRIAAEQAWQQVRGSNARNAPAVLSSASAMQARSVLVEAERELKLASSNYGTAHPSYRRAAERVQSARQTLDGVIASIAEGLRREYEAALATERALDREQKQTRGTIQDINRLQAERESLEREVATNQALYQTLLQRRKETGATSQLQIAGARMVEPAIAPDSPIRPNRKLAVGLAFMLGFGFAAAWVILRGRLDDTIRRTDQIRDELGEELLTAMPQMTEEIQRQAGRAITTHPGSAFAETIRDAATGVLLAGTGRQGQVLMVTSTLPGEGKTTFTTNLALALALYSGKKILLLDGDLRKPRVAEALGLPRREVGITALLGGSASFREAIQRVDESRLFVLPCERAPSNPVARLQKHRLGRWLATLRDHFDVILIDTPPLQLVSDALLIGSNVDSAIYVVKSGETPVPLVQQGIERLRAAHVDILGVALNHHDFDAAERYYGEYSAQGKYGDGYYGGDDLSPATRLG